MLFQHLGPVLLPPIKEGAQGVAYRRQQQERIVVFNSIALARGAEEAAGVEGEDQMLPAGHQLR
eukprot:207897-Hanusia_phi.AAC.1